VDSGPRLAWVCASGFKALAKLQRCDVVHRDLKPANLMIEAVGGVSYLRITDLGSVMFTDSAAR
jgi:serine/threonine protein kinase